MCVPGRSIWHRTHWKLKAGPSGTSLELCMGDIRDGDARIFVKFTVFDRYLHLHEIDDTKDWVK